MRENRDFVVPVNILTPFACVLFSWAARHTTVCLGEMSLTSLKLRCCDFHVLRYRVHFTNEFL